MASTRLVEAESRRPGGPETGGALALAEVMPRLVLESRRVSGTLAHGLHGRRRAGPGESFWQFRPFVPGEAAARVDWRRSARDDRLYVREREWEAAHNIWIWIDRSASMGFASSLAQTSKIERALVLGLALADTFVEGGERVGLLGLTRSSATRGIVERLAQALVNDRAGLTQDLPPAATPGRFDEVVLISDFLTPLDRVRSAVQTISARGTHGHLVLVADPVEETFPFTGQAVLHDPEGGLSLDIGEASAWGEAYRTRIAAHRDGLSEIARQRGWTLTIHRTDRPASEAALRLLTLVAAARGLG
ncbi:UNVERIFIED_ORG: uncharacterized protein (DUF58 family) [Methylobacterium sp. SuP10 SLI 274]|uniref:DUF58 domain-containing protein n=1 Tax=Methylorubrum extorquens TaxID=408 RepID=UPI0020A091E3|nr:DUF58 domain-containing protein [Methylorubrum extorquens]MDF9866280.1 uncharacterized protein (DUF58 family) [Methylorubrum pseudosasae]MDH6639821.1 uncharacterized protein (DUF58 family) [Methylobacterium sp. SuP10 SLI 274]MDH6669017.1 uncharacterized protein (DUF58 family) [Methylorubrum zatmanii]MCP1560895.1 uncharacterized protein (DUF58 family) [Methylorubrum extorquens]MDF9794573.1 uncharacterized protein (DUF58 family) [Methylorubrum extorquens]